MTLKIVPITRTKLNEFISRHHRHHKPVVGYRFGIGVEDGGCLVGACSVGRPVSRYIDAQKVAEVTRLVTDGTYNACSILYSAAARAAKAMGFERIQTYILENEPGTSLKASGWRLEGLTHGGDWNRASRSPRRTDQPQCPKQRWVRDLIMDKQEAANGPET